MKEGEEGKRGLEHTMRVISSHSFSLKEISVFFNKKKIKSQGEKDTRN